MERLVERKRERHGLSKTSEYHTWQSMISRCESITNKSYHRYGERGIKVCARWFESFLDFLEDMGTRPEGYTLERIDNDGDYEPSNCKWDTWKAQALNRNKYDHNTSGVRGVSWHKCSNKWKVQMHRGGKYHHIGLFDSKIDAEVAHLQHYYGFYGKFPSEYKGKLL